MKRCFIVFFALFTIAGALAAQAARRPNTRAGLWWGFGAGGGIAGAECSGCDTEQKSGFSGMFRLGATLSPSLLLGVETNGWFHGEEGGDQILRYFSAVAIYYPGGESAFYLKAGLGFMSFFSETDVGELTAGAAAGSLGAGYEFRVGRNLSIVPFLNSLASAEAEFELDGLSADTDIRLRLFQLGVGITWH